MRPQAKLPGFRNAFARISSSGDNQLTLSESLRLDAALGKLASQVAHDIRSPLAALNVISESLTSLPETHRTLVRTAIDRIEDIANSLLSAHRRQVIPQAVAWLPSLVESIVSEKRVQFRRNFNIQMEMKIDSDGYGAFSRIDAADFKRLLSNLLNNAMESIEGRGSVEICLSRRTGRVIIDIKDTGRGIPEEILPRLMQRGVTVGKDAGNGLGLFHARTSLEKWGWRDGDELRSRRRNNGFDNAARSAGAGLVRSFSVSEKEFQGGDILDDDSSIHHVWKNRLNPFLSSNDLSLNHFSNSGDFSSWLDASEENRDSLFLIDYELLDEEKTGLQVVESLGITARSILVTSRHESSDVTDGCARTGLRLIPKNMVGLVPISLS